MDPPEILREAYLTLQNDPEFHRAYKDAPSRAEARNTIHKHLGRLGVDPPKMPQPLFASNPCRAAREALRQLLDNLWGIERGSDSFSKDVAPYLQAKAPAEAKAPPDYTSLPPGTLLTAANGYVYEKDAPPVGGFPSNIDRYELRGRRVSPHDLTAWAGWDKHGKSSESLRIVSYKLPTSYADLPDGTTLVTKSGEKYLKGYRKARGSDELAPRPPPRSCRPVWGYSPEVTSWQDWDADGTGPRTAELHLSHHLPIGHPDALPVPRSHPVTELNKFVQERTTSLRMDIKTAHDIETTNTKRWQEDHNFHKLLNFAEAYGTTPEALKTLLSTPAADTMAILHHYPPTTMKTIEITTKTLVNGTDISTLSKPAIYDMIAQQEAAIATLEAIKTKPIMLRREIEERQAGVNALVAYLDSLEPVQAVQGLAGAVQSPSTDPLANFSRLVDKPLSPGHA